MAEEQKPKTIAEEAGLPDNWHPIDVKPIIPSQMRDNSSATAAPFVGTLPPTFQQNTDFSGTSRASGRGPNLSLMPLGVQGNPQTNAGIQSTAVKATSGSSTVIVEDVEAIASNVQTGTTYTVQVSDLETLISMSNNSGGTVTLPGPSGTFNFVQVVPASGGGSATVNITNAAGNLMIMSVKISDGGFTSPTVVDTNGNTWTLIAVSIDGGNIPTSFFYAFNIAGGPNTITVTNPSSSVFCLPTVLEYSGFGTSDPLDTFAIASGNVATVITGFDNCLVYNGVRFATAVNPTAGPGFTSRYSSGVQEEDQDLFAVTMGTTVVGDTVPTTFGGSVVNFTGSFRTLVGPSAALFPAGWFTYIENIGSGNFIVTSTAQIDGVVQNITLRPNTGILVVYDGTNWFTMRGAGATTLFYQTVQLNSVSKTQRSRLNFSSAFTATDNPGNNSTDIDLASGLGFVVDINGVGSSTDKKFFMNGVSDGASVWGVNINGVSDGG